MRTEFVQGITIRPLRNGERSVVQAVFDALGPSSRRQRFGGAKNVLLEADLEHLARVDATHHVLVAYAGDDPVAIARLVRHGELAEIAFEVADAWQRRGVGTLLAERLGADARAAGITRFCGDVDDANTASLALLHRLRLAAA